MEWAYIQIASLILIVGFIVYMAVADAKINKDKEQHH